MKKDEERITDALQSQFFGFRGTYIQANSLTHTHIVTLPGKVRPQTHVCGMLSWKDCMILFMALCVSTLCYCLNHRQLTCSYKCKLLQFLHLAVKATDQVSCHSGALGMAILLQFFFQTWNYLTKNELITMKLGIGTSLTSMYGSLSDTLYIHMR